MVVPSFVFFSYILGMQEVGSWSLDDLMQGILF
jgi:hypothetical protein